MVAVRGWHCLTLRLLPLHIRPVNPIQVEAQRAMNRQFAGRAVCALGPNAPSFYNVHPTEGQWNSILYNKVNSDEATDDLTMEVNKIQELLDTMLKKRLDKIGKMNATMCSTMDYQPIMKQYVTALAAVDDFNKNGKMNKGSLNGVIRFLFLSLGLSFSFVGLAVLFAYWGGETSPLVDSITASNFFGWPTMQVHTCSSNATDTVVTTRVAMDGLLVAKNLYCGLMLGLVFGFLDNFGLFYGMDKLDPILYKFGTNVISGAMNINQREELKIDNQDSIRKTLVNTHVAADKLMAGLGNTFRYVSAILGTPNNQIEPVNTPALAVTYSE